jgi:hypothetical protein
MSRLLHNKKITVLAVIGLLVAAGGAYAFWTQVGSGSGTATTGTSTALTIAQTSTVTALSPGAAAQALSGTITNPATGTVHVTSVTATLSATGLPTGCTTSDYLITNPVATVNADVAAGASTTWSGPTLKMVDTGVNQDLCKNATVTISYTSS